jgi:hypothetical protein
MHTVTQSGIFFALRAAQPGMRAQRFPLELAVEYRFAGDGQWHRASTANVSASGVLVRGTALPSVDTHVEFRLHLPARGSAPCGEVSGRGRVVRLTAPAEPVQSAFALAIEKYDLRQAADAH